MSGKQSFGGRIVYRRQFSRFIVTEAAYSPHLELSSHTHKWAHISLALQGAYTEVCGGAEWRCRNGEIIFHVPGECHLNRYHDEGARVLNLEMSPALVDDMNEAGISTCIRRIFMNPDCARIGYLLHSELCNTDSVSELAIEGLGMELIAGVLRYGAGSEENEKKRNSGWLNVVLQVLHDRYREKLELNELASIAQVHPVHMARVFRKRYGCSPGDYLRKLRIEAASEELANSDTPIIGIALQNGFSDQSHLTRTFRQYMGVSPAAFRKARMGQATQSAAGTTAV